MKRISVTAILFSVLCVFSSGFCQSDLNQDRKIYSYQHIHQHHPDGVVGKLSLHFSSSYLSIRNKPWVPDVDAQKFQADIGWIISEKFTERQSFMIRKEVETTYQLSVGFNYYLSNPLAKNGNVNPDGKTGSPIISVDAIMLLDSFEETKSTTNFKTEIIFPLSSALSVFGGYTSYEEINPRDVEKTYGGLHLFLSKYKPFDKFQNPDSPLDGIAIILKGGNSEFGSFGELQCMIPSSESVTISVSARSDFLETPLDISYTGSLQINYYAGK